jgi:hypothetical protein
MDTGDFLPRVKQPGLETVDKADLYLLSSINSTFTFTSDSPDSNKNSVTSGSQRTIPTEQPPLFGEVNANFWS